MGRLAGQVVVIGSAASNQFEDGVGAQNSVVVLIDVVRENAEDTRPSHFQEAVLRQSGVAAILKHLSEMLRELQALVKFAQREKPGIAGEQCRRGLDDDGQAVEKRERFLPSRLLLMIGLRSRTMSCHINKLDAAGGFLVPSV